MSEIFSKEIESSLEETIVSKHKTTGGEEKPVDGIDTEIPASLYEQREGHLLSAKLLGKENTIIEDDLQKLRAIDNYIQDRIMDLELEDTKETYQSILRQFMQVLGLAENDLNKLDKIYQSVVLKQFLQ